MKTPDTLRALSKQSRQSRATTESGERDQINLSRSAFARLLDNIFYPNPDDSDSPHGPFGPAGPVSRLLWAALNPQPLPPVASPYSDLAWVALNPQPLPPEPDPYRAAFAARAVITRAAAQADFAEVLGNKDCRRRRARIARHHRRRRKSERHRGRLVRHAGAGAPRPWAAFCLPARRGRAVPAGGR